MPSPALSGTPSAGSGVGTTFTFTRPSGLAASDRVWVAMVHAPNVSVGFDAVSGETTGVSLVESSFLGSMVLRLFRYDATTARSGVFYSGSPDTPVSTAYAWVAFGLARDAGAPTVPVGRNTSGAAATASTTGPVTTPTITPTVGDALVVDIIGWSRGTTMTPPGGSTELGDVRSGDTVTDRSLWVGSRTVSGGAGVPLSGVTVTNDNPFALSAAAFSTMTVAFVIDAPPTQWAMDLSGGLPGNLQNYSAADREGYPGFGPNPRIEIRTDDPPPGEAYYARMNTHDDDVAPLTANSNPRTQLVGPRYILPGDTRYLDWWTRFPADFPDMPYGSGRYIMFAQFFGPPYTASPTVAFYAHADTLHLTLRNYDGIELGVETAPLNTVWRRPLIRDEWLHFCWRIRMLTTTSGYIELWFQGRKQRLGDGYRARIFTTTAQSDQVAGEMICTNYRSHGAIPGVVTLDHAGMGVSDIPPTRIDLAPPIVSSGRVV